MRTTPFAVLFLCAGIPLSQAQDAPSAEVSGIVLDEATGKAVPRAVVTLSTTGADPLDAVAYTDSRGTFAFTALPARKYFLQAQYDGYLPGRYGASTPEAAPEILVVKSGEVRRGLEIRLRPLGSISGLVLDPDGDPVAHAQVDVLVAGFSRGKPRYFTARWAQTDLQGEYRHYHLMPGRYIVVAKPTFQRARQIQPEGVAGELHEQPMYGVQFYSNADRLSAASVIAVSPGKEVTGVDLRLPLRRVVRLAGTIAAPAECRGPSVEIQGYPQDVPDSMGHSFGASATPPEYKFELPNLTPGAYLLVALSETQGRYCRGVARTEVGVTPDQQISIGLEPGIELSGSVVVEGEGPGPEPARVYLVSGDELQSNGPPPQTMLQTDGTFRLGNVLPGIWDIGVEPIPPGGFIKSMRLGDQDVLTEDMVIEAWTNAPLNIVVSKRGGIVDGTVVQDEASDPQNKAAAKPVRAVVLLAPEGRFKHVLSFYQMSLADATGHFEFKGVTPGTYMLYAFDRMRESGPQDPRFLEPYREAGEPLEVVEGGHLSKKVHMIATAEREQRK